MGCVSSTENTVIKTHRCSKISHPSSFSNEFTKSKYKAQVNDLIDLDSLEKFEKILNKHPNYANLKQPSGNGLTILMVACCVNDVKKAVLLLKSGAYVDAECGVRNLT